VLLGLLVGVGADQFISAGRGCPRQLFLHLRLCRPADLIGAEAKIARSDEKNAIFPVFGRHDFWQAV
jgi:hypothetical protein